MRTDDVALPVFPWHADAIRMLARAAAEDRLGHAWLLHGPAGTGKRRLAEALAAVLARGVAPSDWPRALPADAGPEALQTPPPALPDVHRLSPEADRKTIGVEQVRATIDDLNLTSHAGHARVVIVWPAERMTVSAANGLLKTLEEPPAGVYLLLVSHRPGRLPVTVRSRCQRLSLALPPTEQALAWLARADASGGEWGLALSLSGGSPLAAWAAMQAKLPDVDRERCAVLARMLQGQQDPGDVVEAWLKPEPANALRWLRLRLEDALRDAYSPSQAPHREYAALQAAAARLGTAAVLRLRDGVLRLERLSDGGVNLALALEALLAAPNLKVD